MELPKHCIVTGGAGFIGSHLVEQLLAEGVERVTVVDDLSRGKRSNLPDDDRVTLLQRNCADPYALYFIIRPGDVIFHMAARPIKHCAIDPRLAVREMALGTHHVAMQAQLRGASRVIFSSSASVYGQADVLPTDEMHHPYNNRTLYGALKLFGEGLLRAFYEQYRLHYIALRYFNVYGPRMAPEDSTYTNVFTKWMQTIDEGEAPQIHGDGNQLLDLVYVSDVARANILAAKSPLSDQVFNIGGEVVSLKLLAWLIWQKMGEGKNPVMLRDQSPGQVTRRMASTDRARSLLYWGPQVDLTDGLDRMIEWWRGEHR